MKKSYRTKTNPGDRAQAIVEFALVLPILIALLVGILEVGRLIFIYAAVNNASREAVRYASAIGLDDSGNLKYQYCDGIQEMAQRSAFFTPLTVSITYDHGPGTSSFDTCNPNSDGVDPTVTVNTGTTLDRVQVTVSANYSPMVNLLPISSRTFTSSSARTILGSVEVGANAGPGSGSGSSTATTISGPTATGILVSTDTPTVTASPTTTATLPIFVATFTPLPTSTPTQVPSSTMTATSSATATSTSTPTGTSTPASSCNTITATDISVVNNTNTISMTITNPYIDVTVSSITLVWDENGALGSPKTLTLSGVSLGSTFWSGLNNSTGTATLIPSSTLTLPGHDTSSTVTFGFLQTYKASSLSGTTTITINFSTPGCNSIIKTVQ